jgi:tetratricopeptide (TPR) repeat protein
MANQYVIRLKNGKQSPLLTEEEVKKRILSGEIQGTDDLSVFPNQFAIHAKDYPEFEDLFRPKDDAEDRTQLFDINKVPGNVHEDKTNIFDATSARIELSNAPSKSTGLHSLEKSPSEIQEDVYIPDPETQSQKTAIFERPKEFQLGAKEPAKKRKLPKKSFLIMMLLFLVVYDLMFDEDDSSKKPIEVVMTPVRPQLPSGGTTKVDPQKSTLIYTEGLKPYLEDTVQGYRRAADIFQLALRYDPQNVKALAMLASTYLNLIDSSNKDENTYSVINKLIELSKVKDLDLVETLLAQIEFLATSQRYDAAIQRLVEYSKVSGKFDPILYYYLGWLYYLKGEPANAMKYLNLIPASALPLPKLYYLRGYLHEENKEYDEANAEYKRALNINTRHARSILGLVRVGEKKGELKQMVRYIEFLTENPSLQSPKEYVEALIYRSKLALLFHQPDESISSLERALKIEPKNEDLRLEYYTLLSQPGKDSRYKSLAQMYALVLEGERDIKAGKIHEAISVLLEAKDAFSKSEVPLEKMGDLFYSIGEYQKAQTNFKKALELNPKAVEIAVKLIDSMIHNHDWDDAQQTLAKYRNHPKLKSSVDRLAGDLAFHQENYEQAITFYRKAMARDSIDTDVYSSYATALRELDQCKDAQFFYALAKRLDPFNYEAITGSAKCLLKTDNADAAVGKIQEELIKLPKTRADLLAGIAEIYYLDHQDEKALQFVQQAKDVDADYPESYKIEGLVYLRSMTTKKDQEKKALEALKAYSDRKPSDPFGYIQRFEIFLQESKFDQATEELNKVFEVSPRYPELHYRRAQLYTRLGRTKDALAELQEELKVNPRFAKAMVEEGNIYVRASDLDSAMKMFVKAMEVDTQSPSAKMGAGYVNYLKHQYPSAIALLNAALALDRGNPEIYKKIGYAYRDSGDTVKAGQAFRSYLDLAPDAPDRAQFEQYH